MIYYEPAIEVRFLGGAAGTTRFLAIRGDPPETLPNFGDYGYALNGFTYHLQDLVFLDYFSGNSTIPVNHWFSFQNNKTGGQCS